MQGTSVLISRYVTVCLMYTLLVNLLRVCVVVYMYDSVSVYRLYNLSSREHYHHCHCEGGISSSHSLSWYDDDSRSEFKLTLNVDHNAHFHSCQSICPGLPWVGHSYVYVVQLLGTPLYINRSMNMPSPVEMSDSRINLRYSRHRFTAANWYPCMPLLVKHSMRFNHSTC